MSILDSLYNTKYIGFIDIEFQILQDKISNRPNGESQILQDKIQQPYILELGLIIFEKGKDEPILIDHVNFPLLKNRNIQLISSKYCTVTKQTEDKMIKVEENFTINVSDPISIKNNKELIRFIPNSNIRNKLKNNNIDSDEIEKIQKNVDLLRFNLFRNRLSGKYTNYFNQILDLYNNDELVKKRLINPTNYLNKLKNYLLNMTLVHKENMDIMALNNDFKMYNININKDIQHIDIRSYNDEFNRKYKTSKLYESYLNLKNDYFNEELKLFDDNLNDNLKKEMPIIKAHNPLSDAYFTVIVLLIMQKFYKK
jgi:hypothetical protein